MNFSPFFSSGKYWIDPNEGSAKDAIEVFCKGPETCLTPTKEVRIHHTPYCMSMEYFVVSKAHFKYSLGFLISRSAPGQFNVFEGMQALSFCIEGKLCYFSLEGIFQFKMSMHTQSNFVFGEFIT